MKMVDFELVNRYLRGEASGEERIQVMKWVEESESNREEFMAMRKIYDASLMDEDAVAAGKHADSHILFNEGEHATYFHVPQTHIPSPCNCS